MLFLRPRNQNFGDKIGEVSSLVIGISGGTGSGKSTIAQIFSEKLVAKGYKVSLFSLDQFFFRDIALSPTLFDESLGGEIVDFNCPKIVNLPVAIRAIEDSDSDFTIIEGHLLFHFKELLEKLDLKVFIDVEADIRLGRRILRDMKSGRGYAEPEKIIRYYNLSAKPGHAKWIEPTKYISDFILEGNLDVSCSVDQILVRIEEFN